MDSAMPVRASGLMVFVSAHELPWYGPYVVFLKGPRWIVIQNMFSVLS